MNRNVIELMLRLDAMTPKRKVAFFKGLPLVLTGMSSKEASQAVYSGRAIDWDDIYDKLEENGIDADFFIQTAKEVTLDNLPC